jgi:hypothetical protein
MDLSLSVDRFEGDDKKIAVLVTREGDQIEFPRHLLPRDVVAGDVLTIALRRDVEATKKVVAETREVEERLAARDPGGDIAL